MAKDVCRALRTFQASRCPWLLSYVMSDQNRIKKRKEGSRERRSEPAQMKYHFTGYKRFYDPDGYPAVAPPWGTLNAINLNTGEYVWKIPLGEYPELARERTEEYGHRELWRTAGDGRRAVVHRRIKLRQEVSRLRQIHRGLAVGNHAAIRRQCDAGITYEWNGKQFVVIAAGGGKDLKSNSGGVYVAFALDLGIRLGKVAASPTPWETCLSHNRVCECSGFPSDSANYTFPLRIFVALELMV
jgi:hypothetical protein